MTRFDLLLDRVAEILDELAYLAPAAADRVLRIAGGFIGDALVVQALVVREVARGLLHFALERLGLAVQFVTIHGFLLNNCPAPADDAYQEQHDRDHQKHMDDRSDGVDTNQTEQPRDEQNQRECQQHSVLLFTGASGCRLLRPNESASAAPRAANG